MQLIIPRIEAVLTALAFLAIGSTGHADDGAGAAGVSEEGITITDPRVVQPAAAGDDVAVAMTIRNDGGRVAKLVIVDSPAASRTTMHRTVGTGDSATMQPIPSIDVPGGGIAVELRPEDEHVMLIGLKRALQPGDEVRLSMSFFPGPAFDVRVPVDGLEGKRERSRGERQTSALSTPAGTRQDQAIRPSGHLSP